MDAIEKLQTLSQAGELDAGEPGCLQRPGREKSDSIVLTRSTMRGGKSAILLKSLLTSFCENNCLYCPFRSGRDFPRESFTPDEFAELAVNLTKAGLIQGIFLSSGVAGSGNITQDRLIKTAEILRKKKNYRGYLHLKIMPGSDFDQVFSAMQLADRVSVNLEAPNADRLQYLAPGKNFQDELMRPLIWTDFIRRNFSPHAVWKNRWPSSSTQFIVGCAGESDRELLETTQKMHREHNLERAYFSAFRPHQDTPLEDHPASTYRREQRLYQADYLIRDYGFSQEELVFNPEGNLLMDKDPKIAWANEKLSDQRIEINHANREELLRIPGIGPAGADQIIRERRNGPIRDLGTLKKWGIHTGRTEKFILLNGRCPPSQPALF